AAWLGAAFLREERDYRDAYRLTIAFVGSHASATLLKKVFRRPRPSAELADLRIRSVGQHEREQVQYEYSFPSGHAALAFALVTSYSLSHPRWYVIVPGFAWAATTGISRIWRGRHYPSDVVGGILL